MTPEQLKKSIFENLDNSKANGYEPELWEARDLGEDLVMWAEDLEDENIEVMLPFIEEWLSINKPKK